MHRQLWLPVFAILVCQGPLLATDPNISAAKELQAARLMETTLRNRQTSPSEWQKMRDIYAGLAAKHPKDVRVLNAYGAYLWDQGQQESAEQQWRNAARQEENSESFSHLGASALARGEIKVAAGHYTKASTLAPEDATLHFDLGNVLFLFRHDLLGSSFPDVEAVQADAMKHYAAACRLAPRNVEFARGYAETFYGLTKPNWAEALKAWQHLLEISSAKDFALANLATIHLKLSDREKARECANRMDSPEFATRKARILQRIERE